MESFLELEARIREEAKRVAQGILDAAGKARNEAEFRTPVTRLIEDFARRLGLNLHVREEYTLINGRADAVYNRFIIEYETPRTLRPKNSYRVNQHAIDQVKQYIEELHRRERHGMNRLAGVALDGSYYLFVRRRDARWFLDEPLPVTPESTLTFLRYLASLSTEKALTPDNLIRDFGENTPISRLCVRTLYGKLKGTTNPKVRAIFEQWSQQFSEVCDYEKGTKEALVRKTEKLFGVSDKAADPFSLFFSIHTYYATFIKLLALQAASYYTAPRIGTGFRQVPTFSSDELLRYLREMERGGIFRQLGIKNFLEGDFFGWYLELWDEDVDKAVRRIVSGLANYSLVTLDVDPEETRDLLKKLYQKLMPKDLRHNLGEYYTPDWLAERLLNQVGFDGDPRKRILDPACGSGTFLVLAIKRIRQYCRERLIPESEALGRILENVVGIDLNPLAVITARTNYVLGLGELLAHRTGEITIPVYTADSILTPADGTDLFEKDVFSFRTAVGEFALPASLISARYIDRLADLLEEAVEIRLTPEELTKRLVGTFPLFEDRDRRDLKVVQKLYDRLLDLEKQGVNGIWARIIKNAFAPLFMGTFDYVVGNPPWVNWESLPDAYRQATKSLWERQGLYFYKGQLGKMREGKKDISMLMTYVAMDSYLRKTGRLGFIITQSVFKTSGAGQGFRRFQLGSGTPVRTLAVDDMVEIKPFEGVANRTAIVVLERGRRQKYPVPYTLWKKAVRRKSVRDDMELQEVQAMTTRRNFYAEPVDADDLTSSWITGRLRALKAVKNVLGKSDYEAREGVNTGGANGVYWMNIVAKRPDGFVIVSNITEGAKRKVENVQAAIEPDLLYPLLRGRDVQRWKAQPSAHILITQDRQKHREGIPEPTMRSCFPKIYAYLRRFKETLENRPDRRYYPPGSPFYTMRNVADYTFAPYKVVWKEVAHELNACVVGIVAGKALVPDHTIVYISFDDEAEAYYACAVLNSSPFRFGVQNYIVLHPDPHVLNNVCLPAFESENPVHTRLAEASRKAHDATKAGDETRIAELETEIDELAAKLWGLTEGELKEIQESLEELSG